jgi:cyanophycinase-like exopeptidase
MTPSAGEIFLIAGDPDHIGRGKDPLLAAILRRLGLPRPRVAYVGAASNDSRVFFLWIAARLKKEGAGAVRLAPLAKRHADPAKARPLLEQADVIFVSGGDVELGMAVLERTGAAGLLRELHRAGKPFIGISAGSIMLAGSWVRWANAKDDSTAESFLCLGLAPLLCDTHAEGDDWDELKVLLKLSGAPVGYGIPSGAALHVAPGGPVTALGGPVQRLAMDAAGPRRLPDLQPG